MDKVLEMRWDESYYDLGNSYQTTHPKSHNQGKEAAQTFSMHPVAAMSFKSAHDGEGKP